MRDFTVVTVAAAGAWLLTNAPVLLLGYEQWKVFWTFNSERGADLGSLWLVWQQAGTFRLFDAIPIPAWNVFSPAMWLAFVVFVVSAFAETNRLPFDFAEAEAELVAGYHTEYSSMKFALFFMAEYMAMATMSALIVTLFLVVTALYIAVTVLPGDPVRALFGASPPPPELYSQITAFYELDRPLLVQYVHYVGRLLTGDLGRSYPADPLGVARVARVLQVMAAQRRDRPGPGRRPISRQASRRVRARHPGHLPGRGVGHHVRAPAHGPAPRPIPAIARPEPSSEMLILW